MNDPWVIEKLLVERKLDLVLYLIYEIKESSQFGVFFHNFGRFFVHNQ